MLVDLPKRIRSGKAVVCVVGLGRVGLPLAVVFARSGLRTIGVDVDEHRISAIKRGEFPFHYPTLEGWMRDVLSNGMFNVSVASRESIEASDVVVVTVGTPTGSQYQLDYSQLHSALREVTRANLKDKAIVMRSTAVPGTMKNLVLPMLMKESGLQPGVDFAIAVCPERILEGQAHRELYSLPEIVGAVDDLSVSIASELFRRINPDKKIVTTTPTGAELAKLFTNIYRYVSFALANEFAIWAERYGEDAHELIRIANDGYQRSSIPRPGFAGGPCLGKDGFLLDNGTTFSSIISTAWKLNEAVPQHVADTLMGELGTLYGKKIGVLGFAFKAESDDVRLSPSAKLVDILKAYGAQVLVHDPYITTTLPLDETLREPDAVVLATNHPSFEKLAPVIDESGCKLFYDVWGAFAPDMFRKAKYMRLGRAK